MKLGLTTGACAIAACKAALLSILEGKCVREVIVELPIGLRVQVNIDKCRLENDSAETCVIKDAGDNAPYDVTHGVEICANVRYIPNFPILALIIVGGEGVGLNVRDEMPAISEAVLEYIDRNISEIINKGIVKIEFKIPRGRELWKRTMNKIVGICDGISILGEKGIELPVTNPYSSPYLSHVDKLIEEYAKISNRICLTLGGRSTKIARDMFRDIPTVEVGDHLGYAIDKCVDHGINEINIVGGIAKMIKVSAGLLMMHSAYVDARIEIAIGQLVKYILKKRRELLSEILDIVQDCESIIEFLERVSKYIDIKDFAKHIVETCRVRLVERCLRMKGRNVIFHVYSILPDGSVVGC
ncbi:MAG: cobalt-precorrin-5B (C(1))-methyltransferase [Crenarchaeota archaeon]|nr:cobalt-precorrin-5B (C(1))-methyltransferase [Thermoproteota archaeon]